MHTARAHEAHERNQPTKTPLTPLVNDGADRWRTVVVIIHSTLCWAFGQIEGSAVPATVGGARCDGAVRGAGVRLRPTIRHSGGKRRPLFARRRPSVRRWAFGRPLADVKINGRGTVRAFALIVWVQCEKTPREGELMLVFRATCAFGCCTHSTAVCSKKSARRRCLRSRP